MRSVLDLLQQPYSFTHRPLLTGSELIQETAKRGVRVTHRQLEGLHKFRILTPVLRVSRDPRTIRRAMKEHPALGHQAAASTFTDRRYLLVQQHDGHLHDPATERFRSQHASNRSIGDLGYFSHYYLYSPYDVMRLTDLSDVAARLRFDERGVPSGVAVATGRLEHLRRTSSGHRRLVIILSTIEQIYYPRIVGRLRLDLNEYVAWDRWARRLRLGSFLRWLDIGPPMLHESASVLLEWASDVDPLGEWFTLVREAAPERWDLLSGTALAAIDLRLSAEILLRYHDDLEKAGRARPLPEASPTGWGRSPFEDRLKPQRRLDETLTRFGLSPHPRVVLVLEGPSELALLPLVMDLFGVRRDEDYIRIVNAEGVTKSITSLVAYAITPHGRISVRGGYLEPSRPITRLLSVMDAEGPVATAEQRRRRKRTWVERIERDLPAELRTPIGRRTIERLVHVTTWNRRGDSFEFANFTDLQLADTIYRLDGRSRRPTRDELRTRIQHLRAQHGNLDQVLHGVTKPELAEALWPVLQRKIERAREHETQLRIPIVRALDRAIELARQTPSREVVIPFQPR